MKSKVTLLLSLMSISAIAQEINYNIVKKVEVNSTPTFFFKNNLDGSLISYTLASNPSQPAAGGINIILNTKTGVETKIPGPWDPVFNAGNEYMTLPTRASGNNVYYQFYRVNDLLRYGTSASPIGYDRSLTGLYQSVGLLSQTRNTKKYRIIAEGTGSHKMGDYEFSSNGVSRIGTIKYLCPRFSLKLPMISKDGRELGALDTRTGKTTIFKVNDDGSCKKLFDLGAKFGKVSFSYDGKTLAFHKYNTNNPHITEGFIAIPNSNTTSDIYIYDRIRKSLVQLTNNKRSNALYPEILANGDILYINHPHSHHEKISFITINTKHIKVDSDADFFEYLDHYSGANRAAYIQNYMIANSSIKINSSSQFNRYYDLVIQHDLLWPFMQKAAEQGLDLKQTNLLINALKNGNESLTTYCLGLDHFKNYDKALDEAIHILIKSPSQIHESIIDKFALFAAKSPKVEVDYDKFEYFANYFSGHDDVLTELIVKASDNELSFTKLNIFERYFSNNHNSELKTTLIRLKKSKDFAKARDNFYQSNSYKNLDDRSKAIFIKYTITRYQFIQSIEDLEYFDNRMIDNRILAKLADQAALNLQGEDYLSFILKLQLNARFDDSIVEKHANINKILVYATNPKEVLLKILTSVNTDSSVRLLPYVLQEKEIIDQISNSELDAIFKLYKDDLRDVILQALILNQHSYVKDIDKKKIYELLSYNLYLKGELRNIDNNFKENFLTDGPKKIVEQLVMDYIDDADYTKLPKQLRSQAMQMAAAGTYKVNRSNIVTILKSERHLEFLKLKKSYSTNELSEIEAALDNIIINIDNIDADAIRELLAKVNVKTTQYQITLLKKSKTQWSRRDLYREIKIYIKEHKPKK